MKRLIFILMCLVIASPVNAEPKWNDVGNDFWLTGTKLYNVCSNNDPASKQACDQYMGGFLAGIYASQALAETRKIKPASCIPDGLLGAQVEGITLGFMYQHPEKLYVDAGKVAMDAWGKRFPVRNSVYQRNRRRH